MYEWMPESMEQSKSVQAFSLDWGFDMGEAATQEKINECEQKLELSLPPSYRKFLLKYNGAHLFCSGRGTRSDSCFWWADSGVVVLGTKPLLEYRHFVYDLLDTQEHTFSLLPIAYLGRVNTGDFCALNMAKSIEGENPVIDCDHDYSPSEWEGAVIANSFEEWLKKMFACVIESKSTPEYWFEDTLSDNSLAQA